MPFRIGSVFESVVAAWWLGDLVAEQLTPVVESVLPIRAALVADRDLETQTGLSLRVTQSLVPAEVAEEVIYSAMGYCGAGGGAVWWRISRRDDRYTPVKCIGTIPEELGRAVFPAECPAVEYISSQGPQVRSIADIMEAVRSEDSEPFAAIRGGLIIGLWMEDSLSGFLILAPHLAGLEFSARETKYLLRLAPLAAVGLGNAWTHTREKQVSGLHAMLRLTKEFTAGLDSSRVFSAIVNLPGELIEFDRCALFVGGGDSYRMAALSGLDQIPRKLSPELQRLHDFGSWLAAGERTAAYDSTAPLHNRNDHDPIAEFCLREDLGSAYALPLADEEGAVGLLWWESSRPGHFTHIRREWCRLVANQSTTALRNVLLLHQVPLKSFLMTLGEAKSRWRRRMHGRLRYLVVVATVVLGSLLFVRMPITVRGSCEVQPARPVGVQAQTAGWVQEVFVREGDLVSEGQPVARLSNPELLNQIEDLEGELALAERRRARSAHTGMASRTREFALEWSRLQPYADYLERKRDALLLTASVRGRVLTSGLENTTGVWIEAGDAYCEIAFHDSVRVLVQTPLSDISFVKPGALVKCLFDPGEPVVTRGRVERILPVSTDTPEGPRAAIRATLDLVNPSLHIGLRGEAKIEGDSRPFGYVVFRRPWHWCKKLYWRYFGSD
jgi:hypothetical protein